jgi:hypothetical protein
MQSRVPQTMSLAQYTLQTIRLSPKARLRRQLRPLNSKVIATAG